VAVLGVLKAGAGYVPLDPAYPADRLAYMLDDSAPAVLITRDGASAGLPAPAMPVLALNDAQALAGQPEHNPDAAALGLSPEHLAYIIYTSGSTGLPKGVMVEHRQVARLLSSTEPWFGFGASDVWTLFHSYAFDFSVWELWGALAYGGRLVVVPLACTRAPEDFYRLLCAEGVTVLNQTPSAFRQLIAAQAAAGEDAHSLRYVIFGGEALELHMLAPWFARNDPAKTRLINMYGITETTVHVTWREIGPADVAAGLGSMIGVPIPDLQLYILDRHLQPVPVGVTGEMYVGGAGVARGYLNRPELTAERFLPNTFSGDPQARLYKTGDLGRWTAGGDIEYLGRNDFQVKIRGFRIELGEIEAKLAACQGVRDAVVLAREDEPGQKRLVAYYVPQAGAEVTAASLRQALSGELADYMVPSAFVALEEWPLTPNGKLDRKALPAPDGDAVAARTYEAPQGEVETALAAIWGEVLQLDRVGRHDHFFELGGDSIRSISVVAKAKAKGLSIAIVDLFTYPTIAGLAGQVAASLPGRGAVDDSVCLLKEGDRSILPDHLEDAYGITMLQMGMVYHNHFSGEASLYHDVFSYHVRLPQWSESAFRTVLDAMTRKHPILRTSFDLQHFSEPLQLVHAHASIPLIIMDISGMDSAAQDRAVEDFIDAERKTVFDLESAPLLRVFVHLRGSGTVQYTLSFHHAILDGWSVASLQTELFREYLRMLESGPRSLDLKPLSVTPRATLVLERHAVGSPAHHSFWSEYLEGYSQTTLPPWDGECDGTTDHANRHADIDATTHARLRELATQLKVPMRTILLCAHMRALSMLSGSEDITTGLVSNVRPEEDDGEKVLGLFLNTLPFRQKLSGVSWRDLIRDTFRSELAVIEHRHYPYFQLYLDNGRAPFYEIIFNYINFHVYEGVSAGGDDDQAFAVLDTQGYEETGLGMAATFSHTDGNLALRLQVDPARVPKARAERLFDCYLAVLDAMATAPDAPHGSYDFLARDERETIVHRFNATAADYPAELSIQQVFEGRVSAAPDAVALVCDGRDVSYAELNLRANQVAHRLLALGLKADGRVAVALDRSVELVVAMLGILKAGGAYMVLDPSYPPERLAYMLDDAAPVALLTRSALQLPVAHLALPVLELDTDAGIAAQPAHDPDPAALGIGSRNLAYVCYTSGSTGLPKGVMIEHRGVLRLVFGQTFFAMKAGDRVAQCANPAFDATTWEVWATLLHGATLIVVPQPVLLDSAGLGALLNAERVNILHLTAGLFQQYADALAPVFAGLDYLLFGGDLVDASAVERVLRNCPPRHLLNCYGPTEVTMLSSTFEIGTLADDVRAIPIGRPLANTRIYILNSHGQPVPVGATGELYIGGPGVARGYLNRPELTAERFVADPFGGDPDARLYKTGDLARWRSDGNIEFQGRNDFQVKIRGFRIELGEIESKLSACDGVREAVVLARSQGVGQKQLVAYLTAEDGHEVAAADLRRNLLAALPDYMVPSAFVRLAAFPLTPNGKLDRRALPEPDEAAVAARRYEAPYGDVETALAELWAGLLGLERISRHDHFFDLGGHSLLAVQLAVRVREQFEIDISLNNLFERAVLSELAEHVVSAQLELFKSVDVASLEAELAGLSDEELRAILAETSTL
jgi:amino acid adenylation domain-containing protein